MQKNGVQQKLEGDELTFGILSRHAPYMTKEETQIDMIKYIGQVYTYFTFLFPFGTIS